MIENKLTIIFNVNECRQLFLMCVKDINFTKILKNKLCKTNTFSVKTFIKLCGVLSKKYLFGSQP